MMSSIINFKINPLKGETIQINNNFNDATKECDFKHRKDSLHFIVYTFVIPYRRGFFLAKRNTYCM